jgi:polysaccharide biosynthesis protein PslH
MISALANQVAALDPAVLVVSQLRAAPYADVVPNASLWLDQADVWSLFLKQEIAARRGIPRATATMQLRQIQRAEVAWAHRAVAISTAGYGDRSYLASLAGKPVEWLPNAVTAVDIPRSAHGPRTAGFLGNFAFWPNRDAFNVLRDHWAPALSRIGWKTVVAGIGSEQLDTSSDISIMGRVEDLADYYSQIDVALAPIRLGGGVKVKIIEALMYRRPVLATPYALDGFPPDLASSTPAISAIAPDFKDLIDGHIDASEAFALADRYFSMTAWEDTVARLLDTATRKPSS